MAGWHTAFHCEINQWCHHVLKYHFPKADLHHDIAQTDFTIYRGKIDVLTGGFPCQPFSTAGKRKGTDDERHLWPQMCRAIREIAPSYVVGENVRGLVSWDDGLVFEQVQADLEMEGYEVLPFLLPACAVNAPHRRDRVWFVAYAEGLKDHGKGEPRQSNQTSEAANWQNFPTQPPICGGDDGLSTDLDGITFSKWRNESIKAYGNAIVPQVALQLFKSINEIH